MESTSCNVQHHGQQVDVVAGLLPMPTSIKDQMPFLATNLQWLAVNVGREAVQLQLRASIDLRRAFDADDYRGVNEVYRRGHGWVNATENGFLVGVPTEAMQAFAKRHRGA